MSQNRDLVERAFADWTAGRGHVKDLFADDMTWEIVGESRLAGRYTSTQDFTDRALGRFAALFEGGSPLRPVEVSRVHDAGDTVVVVWVGEGAAADGRTYRNTYAWFLTLADGLVVDGLAFFDTLAVERFWGD